ncbi:MAG: hypothetical protein ACR2MG_19255 [Pyrinomonadaceae bacterium]
MQAKRHDGNYKARNIVGLASESRVIDPATNLPKGKSQISYDQTSYLESPTITNAPGWTNPNTSYRGLPTSTRSWTDVAANQYVETHNQYD